MTGAQGPAWLGRMGQIIDRGGLARAAAIAAGAGVFLAFVGPFGTYAAPLGVRLIYWPLLATVGTALGILISGVVGAVFDADDRRPLATAGLTALIMTPPSTLVVYVVTRWLFGGRTPFADPWGFAGPVFVISAAMNLINALAQRQPVQTHSDPTPDAPPPRFLDRLPPRLRGAEIYAVEAQDHYLRLHTSKGTDLILMRLSDAIAELEGLEGAQTHRSWWVAKAAVVSARRKDGRAMLELPGGVQAPVSRNYARALKTRGWF